MGPKAQVSPVLWNLCRKQTSKWSTCVLLSETNIGHDNPQGTTASGTQAVSGITTLPGIQASGTTAASGMTTLEAFKPSGTKPGLCVACLVQRLVNCLNVFRQKKQGRRGRSNFRVVRRKRSSKKALNTKNRQLSRVLSHKDKANDSSQQRC
jgi:hypothetical protein